MLSLSLNHIHSRPSPGYQLSQFMRPCNRQMLYPKPRTHFCLEAHIYSEIAHIYPKTVFMFTLSDTVVSIYVIAHSNRLRCFHQSLMGHNSQLTKQCLSLVRLHQGAFNRADPCKGIKPFYLRKTLSLVHSPQNLLKTLQEVPGVGVVERGWRQRLLPWGLSI